MHHERRHRQSQGEPQDLSGLAGVEDRRDDTAVCLRRLPTNRACHARLIAVDETRRECYSEGNGAVIYDSSTEQRACLGLIAFEPFHRRTGNCGEFVICGMRLIGEVLKHLLCESSSIITRVRYVFIVCRIRL